MEKYKKAETKLIWKEYFEEILVDEKKYAFNENIEINKINELDKPTI